jgi:LmbE family N-acetylglucosaminyl deacetylase
MNGNVIVLAPHTDDGELGCGATIAKYKEQGRKIIYLAFANCSQTLPTHLPADTLEHECRKATAVLGIDEVRFFDFEVRKLAEVRQEILDILIKVNKELQPVTVFLPAMGDVHQDHQVIYAEGVRAFKFANLLGYELPWNNTNFQPEYFEPVNENQLAKKMEALKEYKTQIHRKYMQGEFTRSLAVVRGIQCNQPLAEAFEIYKMVGK